MRDLRPDQLEPALTLRNVRPSQEDAQKPGGDRQEFPIAVDRVAGEIAVGDSEYRQRQHSEVGQVAQENAHRKEFVRMRFELRFRLWKVNGVAHRQSNLPEAAVTI